MDERLNEDLDALKLEKRFVHEVYDAIAPEFSSTRHSAWPGVMQFLANQPPDAIGVDVGCGNGKYLVAMSQLQTPACICMAALERSVKLAQIVRDRGFDVTIGDIMQLPYRPGWFDFFICIAVLHHLSTPARRIQALHELATMLRPGGQGLIQVWAKEQRDPNCCEPATYIRRKTKKNQPQSDDSTPQVVEALPGISLPVHVSGTEFPQSDMLVPWKTKTKSKKPAIEEHDHHQDAPVRDRYYHLFVHGELDQLIDHNVPSFQIQKSYYEQGNWVVQVVKLPTD